MLGLGTPGCGDDYLGGKKDKGRKEGNSQKPFCNPAFTLFSTYIYIYIYNVILDCPLYTFMVPIGKEDGKNDSVVPFD